MAATRKGQQQTPLNSNIAWCAALPAGAAVGRNGTHVALPLQHSWSVAPVSPGDGPLATSIEVHLYVRGGPWIEQFASKLVGEVGGNRHLSSIYVTGELRAQGEAEYKARLESKGWTLPAGFQCDEWVLYQRQGEKIIIKLGYSKHPALDGVTVFLEAGLSDRNVWWSLPVLVDTGNELVFGCQVAPGVYSPAIEGQEVAIGISNGGTENVAVMPSIDGRHLLKAPYFLWAGDARKRNWETGGSTFVTFPGLQSSMQKGKRERIELVYKTLKFQQTQAADHQTAPDEEQGKLKVFIFRTKKLVLKSDPDKALEQTEQSKQTLCSAPVAKSIGPLRLGPDSKDLHHYDYHLASTSEEVKQSLAAIETVYQAQQQIGEVVINYRSLSWFREAAAAKHRLPTTPKTNAVLLEASSSPPTTPGSLNAKTVRSGPDSISPLQNGENATAKRPGRVLPPHRDALATLPPMRPSSESTLPESLISRTLSLTSKDELATMAPSLQKSRSFSSEMTSSATFPTQKGRSSEKATNKATKESSSLFERLSQPKVKKAGLVIEPFALTLRSSSTPKERPSSSGTPSRDKTDPMTPPARSGLKERPSPSSSSGSGQKGRFRDTSSSPSPNRNPEMAAPVSGGRAQRQEKPTQLRDRSPAPISPKVGEKSSANGRVRLRDKSPAPSEDGKDLREGQKTRATREGRAMPKESVRLARRRSLSIESRNGGGKLADVKVAGASAETILWVMPKIQGRDEPLQKDEIVLGSSVRNVAHLRRQVKQDLSPLLDDWSTAELTVRARDQVFEPDTILGDLPAGVGAPSNPIIIEAPEKSEKVSPAKPLDA